VVLYFSDYPSNSEFSELNNLGIVCHIETWTPALPNHPYGYFIAELPITQLYNALSLNFIRKIGTAAQPTYPKNNEAAKKIKADSTWLKGYTGKGVKIAILDSGLDTEPLNSDLPTEIEKEDYSNYPASVDTVVENTVTGHGTHVTGTVLGRGILSASNTGNGNGSYKGIAPDAKLVFLKIGNDADGAASTAAMVGAAHAAVNKYDAGILTMSYGSWDAYHDGTSAEEQTIDWVYSKGVPFFVAAGNNGVSSRHYSGTVEGNSSTGYIRVNITNVAASVTRLYFNLVWCDGNLRKNLNLRYYDASFGELTNISRYTTTESPRGTESQYSSYTAYVPSGNNIYYLKVDNPSSTSQLFHLYEELGDGKVTFNNPDPYYTIEQPASADYACAVAAFVSRKSWRDYSGKTWSYGYSVNDVAPFSSRGPRVDGFQKPNITAPGSVTISIRDRDVYTSADNFWIDNDGITGSAESDYYVMQGTSMACPVAAGAAALILNRYPDYTPMQVYNLLTSKADVDAFTWSVPNSIWGYGKLNINATIQDTLPPIIIPQPTTQATLFKLYQNYPNPFNGKTKITFSIANAGHTTLKVYNMLGKEIATLFASNAEAEKLYEISFEAGNLTSGVYVYRIETNAFIESRKMILMK
jgi:subtilisin family serine protease